MSSIQTAGRIQQIIRGKDTGNKLVAYRRVRSDLDRFAVAFRRGETLFVGTVYFDYAIGLDRVTTIGQYPAGHQPIVDAVLEVRQANELERI